MQSSYFDENQTYRPRHQLAYQIVQNPANLAQPLEHQSPRKPVSCDDTDMPKLALAGLVQQDILNGHLKRLPIERASFLAAIGLTTRTDEALVGPVLRFVEIIRKISNNPSCTISAFL